MIIKRNLDYNLKVIDRLERRWVISERKKTTLKLLNILWTNPVINYKTSHQWLQIGLVTLAHKVKLAQAWIVFDYAKKVLLQIKKNF